MANWTFDQSDSYPDIHDTILDPDTGQAFNLTGCTVHVYAKIAGAATLAISAVATIVDPVSGTVKYSPTATDTAVVGTYELEWEVTTAGARVFTFPKSQKRQLVVEADLN